VPRFRDLNVAVPTRQDNLPEEADLRPTRGLAPDQSNRSNLGLRRPETNRFALGNDDDLLYPTRERLRDDVVGN
jgi:hypothetical protein